MDEEWTTNYLSAIHLTKAFLPHLQKLQKPNAIAFTTSQLALVPLPRCPNYCASKAALHHFILTLRAQLRANFGHVKVLEILLPAVQTELHDARHQPNLKNGHLIGMSLEDYINEVWTKLSQGDIQNFVNAAKNTYEALEEDRQKLFAKMPL